MRKELHFLVFTSVLALLFASCSNLTMPKKVSVKTDASYEFALGNADLTEKVKEIVGPDAISEKLKGSIPEGSESCLYEVDSDNLEYVFRYPIQKKDFGDISSLTGGMNPDDLFAGFDLSSAAVNQSISIPSVSKSMEQSLSNSDIADLIKNNLNGDASFSTPTFNVSETGSESALDVSVEGATVNFSKCEKVLYKSGAKLTLKFNRTDNNSIGDGYKLYVKAYIPNSAGGVYTTTDFVDVTNGGTVYLPLRGAGSNPLESGFTVNFEVKTVGGVLGTSHSYSVSGTSSTDIAKVYGVKDLEFSNSISTDVDLSSAVGIIKSATIGGDSALSIKAKLPESWGNKVSLELDSFTLTGLGLSLSKSNFADETETGYALNKKASLSGKTITPSGNSVENKLNVTAGLKFVIGSEGVDIDLTAAQDKVTSEIDFTINKFSEVKVDASQFIEGGKIESSVPIDETLVNTVSEISFGSTSGKKYSDASNRDVDCEGFGIKFKATNTFPSGSDIPMNINVAPFGMNKDLTIESSFNNEPLACVKNVTYAFTGSDSEFKFTVTIGNAGVLTLKDIVPGEEYTFGISDLELVHDWDYVKIKKSSVIGEAEGFTGNMDVSSFNISSMIENESLRDAIEKIQLKELPVFFYVSIPESSSGSLISRFIGEDSGFNGKIYIEKNDDTHSKEYLVGDDSSTKTIKTVNVSWPAEGEKISTTSDLYKESLKLAEGEEHPGYSIGHDFKNLLEGKMASINYEISLSGVTAGSDDVTIYSFDFDENNGQSNVLSIEAAIKMPLALTVTEDISIKFDDLTDGTDIFNRGNKDSETEENSESDYSKYINAIEEMGIIYSIDNKVLPEFTGTCEVKLYEGTDHEITKSVMFVNGTQKLSFTRDEINTIMTCYPLVPRVSVKVPAGVYNMKKSGLNSENAFSVSSKIMVKSNGEPITVWEKTEGGAK